MLEQKFKLGERVTTPAKQAHPDGKVWIIDGAHLRIRPGREPYIAYSLRLINCNDDDDNNKCCSYFKENELISCENNEEKNKDENN